MINGGGLIRCCPLKLDMGGHISTTGPLSAESFGCSERGHPGAMFQNASASGRRYTVGSVAGQPTASGRSFGRNYSAKPTCKGTWTGRYTLWTAPWYELINALQVPVEASKKKRWVDLVVGSAPRFISVLKDMESRWPSSSVVASGTNQSSYNRYWKQVRSSVADGDDRESVLIAW